MEVEVVEVRLSNTPTSSPHLNTFTHLTEPRQNRSTAQLCSQGYRAWSDRGQEDRRDLRRQDRRPQHRRDLEYCRQNRRHQRWGLEDRRRDRRHQRRGLQGRDRRHQHRGLTDIATTGELVGVQVRVDF